MRIYSFLCLFRNWELGQLALVRSAEAKGGAPAGAHDPDAFHCGRFDTQRAVTLNRVRRKTNCLQKLYSSRCANGSRSRTG